MTQGIGADSVLECVGTRESLLQALDCARHGGHVGVASLTDDAQLDAATLFSAHVHLHGGPAPVRRFLPHLIDLVCNAKIDPGRVFDLSLPLGQAAETYRAMDECRALRSLLLP